jgi:hypothetical protein
VLGAAGPGPGWTARATACRRPAVLGLAGALLGALGDVLLLGRACSGRDCDAAISQVRPASINLGLLASFGVQLRTSAAADPLGSGGRQGA